MDTMFVLGLGLVHVLIEFTEEVIVIDIHRL